MDYLKDLPIQKRAKQHIINSMKNHRLAHAYLLHGPEGSGKEAFALELAKALNCKHKNLRPCNICSICSKINNMNHPDIKFIFPTAKNWDNSEVLKKTKKKAENPYSGIDLSGHTIIQIEKIRELQNESKYTPFEADKKVYIVSDADKMSREGSNSFLKLLEEPPPTLLIILITSNLSALMETIRSRCQIIYFPKLSIKDAQIIVQKYHEIDERVEQLIQISQCNLKTIFQLFNQNVDEKRQLIYLFLKASASGNAMLLMQAVDSITSRRDKNFLMDILNLLTLWFKDVINLKSNSAQENIINVDFQGEIRSFTTNYINSNFEEIICHIEDAMINLTRNVYNPLLLTVLGIRIKRNLVKKIAGKSL